MGTELHLLYCCQNLSFCLVPEFQKSHKLYWPICFKRRNFIFFFYRSFFHIPCFKALAISILKCGQHSRDPSMYSEILWVQGCSYECSPLIFQLHSSTSSSSPALWHMENISVYSWASLLTIENCDLAFSLGWQRSLGRRVLKQNDIF